MRATLQACPLPLPLWALGQTFARPPSPVSRDLASPMQSSLRGSSSKQATAWPPPPPENETPEQRQGRLDEEVRAKKRSDEIDKEIHAQKELKKKKGGLGAKILLLGTFQSENCYIATFIEAYLLRCIRASGVWEIHGAEEFPATVRPKGVRIGGSRRSTTIGFCDTPSSFTHFLLRSYSRQIYGVQ